MSETIRDQDMFGHVITFNFNKKGDAHNTTIGGCFSIIIKMGLLAYWILCFKRMIMQERDETITVENSLNLEIVGDIAYDALQMTPFWVLRK